MLDLISSPARKRTGNDSRRLKRIAPLQFGKMMGVLYGLMGLIFLPFFVLFALIGAFAQNRIAGERRRAGAFAMGGMLVMGLLMPVFYGAMGFIFGMIGAALYNVIARWIGGIEVEVE